MHPVKSLKGFNHQPFFSMLLGKICNFVLPDLTLSHVLKHFAYRNLETAANTVHPMQLDEPIQIGLGSLKSVL